MAENVGEALVRVENARADGTEIPLAVFAADITGNPHYFDRGTTAGQLLIHGICYLENTSFPGNAHQWRGLLLSVGIVPDNVSSMVHAFGLRIKTMGAGIRHITQVAAELLAIAFGIPKHPKT